MKRILITLCAVILSFSAQAQEHMTFKGVSMGCDITTFVSQLESKGFTVDYEADNGVILTGDFAGKSSCKVYVLPTKQSKMVWKVAVKFPEQSSWYSIRSEYRTFKDSYTEKYGKPESYEFFSSPYEDGDGYEMTAIAVEKCNYVSFFTTDIGFITLEIHKDKCVQVSYEDSINSAIKSKEKEASVVEDI